MGFLSQITKGVGLKNTGIDYTLPAAPPPTLLGQLSEGQKNLRTASPSPSGSPAIVTGAPEDILKQAIAGRRDRVAPVEDEDAVVRAHLERLGRAEKAHSAAIRVLEEARRVLKLAPPGSKMVVLRLAVTRASLAADDTAERKRMAKVDVDNDSSAVDADEWLND